MRSHPKLAALTVAFALSATPAFAAGPSGDGPQSTPKGNAYGRYCQGESKRHVEGTKGTPFSQCVRAMARLDRGQAQNPREACQGLSKDHFAGMKGTPFSQCVVAGAKLLND